MNLLLAMLLELYLWSKIANLVDTKCRIELLHYTSAMAYALNYKKLLTTKYAYLTNHNQRILNKFYKLLNELKRLNETLMKITNAYALPLKLTTPPTNNNRE